MSNNVKQATEELMMPILQDRNLELVDIEYVKEGADWFLRIFIDKEGGISIDECGHVSGEIGEKLDEKDLIQGAYFLEVSSPGVERPLKTKADLSGSVNKNIFITLYVHINGEKEYEGILKEFKDDIVTIEYKDKAHKKLVEIPYDKIAKARLAVVL